MTNHTVNQVFNALNTTTITSSLVSREEIQAKAMQGDHHRSERIKDTICNSGVWLIRVSFLMLAVAVVVYAINMMLPKQSAFLTVDQTDKIFDILKLVGTGGVAFFFGKKAD